MGKIFKFLGVLFVIYIVLGFVIKPIPEEIGGKIILWALFSVIPYLLIKLIKYIKLRRHVRIYNKKVDQLGEMLDRICAERGMFTAEDIVREEIQNEELQHLLNYLRLKGKKSMDKEKYMTDFLFVMEEAGVVYRDGTLNQEGRNGEPIFKSTHPVSEPSGCLPSFHLNFD